LVAQQPARFRSSTDVVEVQVTVRAADGALVRDLTSDDFEIDEDGCRREIVVFSGSVQPVTVGLLVDRSRGRRSAETARSSWQIPKLFGISPFAKKANSVRTEL
jgi:hypothetical protein